MNNTLEKWRAEIDSIDDELLTLLNRRARLVAEIGQMKKREHAPLLDPDREREILARVCESSDGSLNETGIKKIFQTIIDESRRIQSVEGVSKTASQVAKPQWNQVTIIGCGLIGASFALALRKTGTCRRIAGWDIDEAVLREALRRSIIDEVDSSFADSSTSRSDLIYLAMPIGSIIDFFREHGQQIKAGTVVTDAGSTKVEICRAAREHLREGVIFVGGHPIAGSDQSGLAYSDADLFTGIPYVLVNDVDQTDQRRAFDETLKAIGACVRLMTSDAHDRALTFISHLPQLLSSSLAVTVVDQTDADELLDLSGSGFRDMTRLAGSSWSMWRGILETNRAQITTALDAFAQRLEMVRQRLRAFSEGGCDQITEIERIFTEANYLARMANRGAMHME